MAAELVSRTIADGTRTQSIGRLNFAHLRAQLDGVVTVTEAEIAAAVRLRPKKRGWSWSRREHCRSP